VGDAAAPRARGDSREGAVSVFLARAGIEKPESMVFDDDGRNLYMPTTPPTCSISSTPSTNCCR
jgi:hypothetical protein